MKNIFLIFLLLISITVEGQNFFWSHNLISTDCRPTGLVTKSVWSSNPSGSFIASVASAELALHDKVCSATDLYGINCQSASFSVGDSIYSYETTECSHPANGNYLIEIANLTDSVYTVANGKITAKTGAINRLFWYQTVCEGEGNVNFYTTYDAAVIGLGKLAGGCMGVWWGGKSISLTVGSVVYGAQDSFLSCDYTTGYFPEYSATPTIHDPIYHLVSGVITEIFYP